MDPSSPNPMPSTPDPFDVQALQLPAANLAAVRPSRKPPRHRAGEKFLKGPIPWAWLERAWILPGKALQVALLLWREAGCQRCNTVRLCLRGELPPGLNRQAARRGLRQLVGAGLVSIRHLRGRGLEVTLQDVPPER
ncbi:MAG: hypothetical protein L0Z62_43305 [Gemmataceae bacterium]|nr:hypothetical protein [Gemmataceae bacterium]